MIRFGNGILIRQLVLLCNIAIWFFNKDFENVKSVGSNWLPINYIIHIKIAVVIGAFAVNVVGLFDRVFLL